MESNMEFEFGEDESNMRVQREANTGWGISTQVPRAAAYCEVMSTANDDEGTDASWVPDRAEEDTEGVAGGAQRGQQHEDRVESRCPTPSPAVVSQLVLVGKRRRIMRKTSPSWAFFDICEADSRLAICKLCQKQIKRGKDIWHLGTTCLTKHLKCKHYDHVQDYIKGTQKGQTSVTLSPSLPPSLHQSFHGIHTYHMLTASTDSDDGIAVCDAGASSACTTSASNFVDFKGQVILGHMLELICTDL